MKKILLIGAVLFIYQIHAQTFEWVKAPEIDFNNNPDLIGYVTTVDSDSNIYLSGFADNRYIYTDIFGDLFFKKYNDQGQLLWEKTFTGKGQIFKITTDSQKNTIVAAAFIDQLNIEATTLTSNEQGVEAVLLKFSPDGTLLWHEIIELGEFNNVNFKAVVVDAQDNIYLGYDNFWNSNIQKRSPDGQSLLTITQNNVSLISSVSIDNQGNIYAAGSCAESNATFNGVSAPTSLTYNTYISKYDTLGSFQWVKYVEDITCPTPQVVAYSPDAVYFCSELNGDFSFDDIQIEGPQTSFMSDFFLAKLNAAGQFQWVKEIIGSGRAYLGNRNFLNLDAQGNIYWVGSFSESISWNSQFQSQSNGFRDALILKYNPEGEVVLAKSVGGDSYDRFDSVAVDQSGNIYLSGIGSNNFTFDAIPFSGSSLYNPFLAKLNPTSLNLAKPESMNSLIYPNPAHDVFFLNSTGVKQLSIYNLLGQKIKEANNPMSGIDISDLSFGTYLVKTDMGVTFKLIKN
ncbi:T9SS type A sorting domain-containing protein [Flavobacterium sp. CYK-55]|uniref:T9SS type A sorting domain-containing protein n=1 Tax=Flavobacterium sp. CYK-55 TaxID=2835529 RepID=UPI001BCAA7EB|nr:T9SS type A sorting domain-containing protein [Flavobacterium sp. CYK-55]MBS7786698.1 T9SS type A sorting domain-containing protein [Flavobacterium sp. CYK-55]